MYVFDPKPNYVAITITHYHYTYSTVFILMPGYVYTYW